MSTYLTTYRVGDIVDIKANAAEQKGMPHKCEHQTSLDTPRSFAGVNGEVCTDPCYPPAIL